MKTITFSLLLLGAVFSLSGQHPDAEAISLRYMQSMMQEWGLESSDIQEFRVSDIVYSKHNGVTHVYLIQQYSGVDIYNSINTINIAADGSVIGGFNRFHESVSTKINTTESQLSPEEALGHYLEYKKIYTKEKYTATRDEGGLYVIEEVNFALNGVQIKPMYMPVEDEIRLSWDITFDESQSPDFWNVRVDAINGQLLDEHNYTVKCSMGHGHVHSGECTESHNQTSITPFMPAQMGTLETGSYNVFELPAESPIHAPGRTLVVEPDFPEASPQGWHNTVDLGGDPEFTITRGNNVHSYADRNAANAPSDPEPDGGMNLNFDFNFDEALEPNQMRDAAITNLFYMNNMIHDITYLYGFDEQAGNFQVNNFGNGGQGGDAVNAEGLDGSGFDNANFATPPDGASGRMQMFLWNQTAGSVFFGESPASIQRSYNVGRTNEWGADITEDAVIGSLAIVDDGFQNGSFGCAPLVNASEIDGKVAFVDRGGCFFSNKAQNAQNAGAIGVVICNFENDVITMAAGDDGSGDDISIPVVMLASSDCQEMKLLIENGEDVQVRFQNEMGSGPTLLAGSYDNGIIAHEYMHGISNRLTGGPSQAGCLGNDEQMGEGWSDFLTLVMTVEPGDEGTDRRGIGNYAIGSDVLGRGIRRAPYSTDLDVYPFTYTDIQGTTAPHPLGEVWNAALWDIYWALVDVYGYDADWRNMSSGNAIAFQLVMDGMKFQACSPGFEDGRDAILQADLANYDGVHQCLIWEAFAKRGVGFEADQGSSFDRNDLEEDFGTLPICVNRVVITKELESPVLDDGESSLVTVNVANFKSETVTNVVITEAIPSGLTVDASTISDDGVIQGDNVVWTIESMESLDEVELTYMIEVPQGLESGLLFTDGFEDGDGNWSIEMPSTQLPNLFQIVNDDAFEGNISYFVRNITTQSDGASRLIPNVDVDVTNPVIRFWHRYETQAILDGGFVEVSADNGQTWDLITSEDIFRNSYDGIMDFQTLVIPNLQSWSGNSDGWIDSYISLEEYQGENVTMRFRFGTSDDVGGEGWWIDQVQFVDLLSYQSDVCVQTEEGDNECASWDGRGVLIEPGRNIGTSVEEENLGITYEIMPNPTSDILHLRINSTERGDASVVIYSSNGVQLDQRDIQLSEAESMSFDVGEYSAGMYLLEIQTEKGNTVQKFVVQ